MLPKIYIKIIYNFFIKIYKIELSKSYIYIKHTLNKDNNGINEICIQ